MVSCHILWLVCIVTICCNQTLYQLGQITFHFGAHNSHSDLVSSIDILIAVEIICMPSLLELFHERCSLDKWYRQAAHTQFTCDFVIIFERAVDLRMKIASHAFISTENVCLHPTPIYHLLITQKKASSRGKHDLSEWTGECDKNHRGKYNLSYIFSRRRFLAYPTRFSAIFTGIRNFRLTRGGIKVLSHTARAMQQCN